MPNARIISRGITSLPILKWSRDRSVCAPQYLSAGTSISPIESVSMRVFGFVASWDIRFRALLIHRLRRLKNGRADFPRWRKILKRISLTDDDGAYLRARNPRNLRSRTCHRLGP